MIMIIEDDLLMANCVKKACRKQKEKAEVLIFANALEAMEKLDFRNLPELIFLDILLVGPNGFTFLNELASYEETRNIPIVVISSLELSDVDLSGYGVVGVLNKATMVPEKIMNYVEKYTN